MRRRCTAEAKLDDGLWREQLQRNLLSLLTKIHHIDIMAPKRKFQEPEAQSEVHASRHSQVYGNKPRPAKKPRNAEPARKQLHASSVNAIKKKIRDVSRRLEKSENLPADVRVQDERALATYEQELAEAETEKARQKMIKKYHMVRFFGTWYYSCFYSLF